MWGFLSKLTNFFQKSRVTNPKEKHKDVLILTKPAPNHLSTKHSLTNNISPAQAKSSNVKRTQDDNQDDLYLQSTANLIALNNFNNLHHVSISSEDTPREPCKIHLNDDSFKSSSTYTGTNDSNNYSSGSSSGDSGSSSGDSGGGSCD